MLSIVVSWRDRLELLRSLPTMAEVVRRSGGDLTVVNYGGSQAMLSNILGRSGIRECRVVYRSGEQYFNKARAQNLGALASRHSVLFFCDCDILLDSEPVLSLAQEVDEHVGWFATLAGVVESERNSRNARNVTCFGYELTIRTANGRTLRISDHEEDAANGSRQAPGLLLVRRSDFVEIGGYNGRLHGWGWEDQDVIARLTLGGGLKRVQRGIVTHLSHGDDARTAHYPPAATRWESRDRMFRQALAYYDDGDLIGTLSSDATQDFEIVDFVS